MTPSPSELPPSATGLTLDETKFPKGHCRYILMTPGLKGQRCACVSFIHNRGVPGASCDCGHLSCFHVATPEDVSPKAADKIELELLKQRVHSLEEPAEWAVHGASGPGSSPQRVRQLEEAFEKHREEVQADIKGAYRSVSGAWQLVEQLQKRIASFEDIFRSHGDQLARAGKELKDLRNRQLELQDSDESLEERIEKLEGVAIMLPPQGTQYEMEYSPDTSSDAAPVELTVRSRRCSMDRPGSKSAPMDFRPVAALETRDEPQQPIRPRRPSGSWTVHVSLMPSKDQPFPFEKDTVSYKRCLSRGLHRMVAVEGTDSASFATAISRTFGDILQSRGWEPLQVQVSIAGSPRLKQLDLDPDLANSDHGAEFLRKHCAVCDGNGRIEAIYIAPALEKLSWPFLKQLPRYLEGLESSWAYDKYLDGMDCLEYEGSDVLMVPLTSLSPSPASSLKRSISEISLSTRSNTSSGASQEYVSPRGKVARTCMDGIVEISKEISATL